MVIFFFGHFKILLTIKSKSLNIICLIVVDVMIHEMFLNFNASLLSTCE